MIDKTKNIKGKILISLFDEEVEVIGANLDDFFCLMGNIETDKFIKLYDMLVRVDLIERINFIREDDHATQER